MYLRGEKCNMPSKRVLMAWDAVSIIQKFDSNRRLEWKRAVVRYIMHFLKEC